MEGARQLFCACEQGDVNSVQMLLDQRDCDVDCVDDSGNTPLQVASANGYENVVRLLIMRGAGLDKRNVFGWTPLLQASRYGHTGVVALLIQHQADIHARNRYGASASTLAARGGHIQAVKLLFESGVDLNAYGEGCEFTPLLAAALHGHDAVLRFLLDRGCEVNFRTQSSGLTPLMMAAMNGHMTTAQILIERGGDPNLISTGEKTALGIAAVRGKREVRGYLDRKTTNRPQISPNEVKLDIIEAAKHGDTERIREILNQDPKQKDASSPQDGATPLMFAAMTGRLDIAELLVQRGCDINKQDVISGWTALMQATYHGKKHVAMFLLNVGADVTVQARNGCTAFDMASLIDDVDTELLRMLASKALHVNKSEKVRKRRSKRSNGAISSSHFHPEFSYEEPPKSGLKAWWSRMSNRFRNLKLGRTFTMTNRLAPMPLQVSTSVQDLTYGGSLPLLVSPVQHKELVETDQTSMSVTSYETMLMETKKSASVYTLDINPPNSARSIETLKPVKPPFLPQPSFALDGPEHSRHFASNWRSYKFMADDRTMTSVSSNHSSGSPSSSGDASNLASILHHTLASKQQLIENSSLSLDVGLRRADFNHGSLFLPNPYISSIRSTLPANQTPSLLFMPRRSATASSAFRTKSNTTSPNSSTSGSSSITPQCSSRGCSTSSKDSTASTLTPSPSPIPGKIGEECMPSGGIASEKESRDGDELSRILKKLSLEKYNPIFEEQEVDMEAFLTLTDEDLKELGIPHADSRRQILKAISELNSGKGRERQQFVDTMTSFNSTLKARTDLDAGTTDGEHLLNWNIPDDQDPRLPDAKSRSS